MADSAMCGEVVTTDLTLGNDLRGCPGDGLIIAAGGVTIDLNGHVVSGSGGGTGIVVSFSLPADVSIKNGVVKGFDFGVYSPPSSTSSLTMEHLRVSGNGTEIFWGGSGSLSDSEVIDNHGDGIVTAHGSKHIFHNTIARNGSNGLRGTEDSTGTIEDNHAFGNAASGLSITDSVTYALANQLSHNGLYGLYISDRLPGFLPFYVVADNVADSNGVGGIRIDSTCCVPPPYSDSFIPPAPPTGTGNSAHNNGEGQCEFFATFGSTITYPLTYWGCARNQGQAKKYVPPNLPIFPLHSPP